MKKESLSNNAEMDFSSLMVMYHRILQEEELRPGYEQYTMELAGVWEREG